MKNYNKMKGYFRQNEESFSKRETAELRPDDAKNISNYVKI